jgi:recombinational DNA repair protein RecR
VSGHIVYPRSPDEAAEVRQDVLGILHQMAVTLTRTRPHSRPALEVCGTCGALERADRPCQVCAATRRAAA